MAARRRRNNGRFMKSAPNRTRRRRNRTVTAAANPRRRRRNFSLTRRRRNPVRRRRNYTIVARNRHHRRRHRNPSGKGFIVGAAMVALGIAGTEFVVGFLPSINIGGPLGTIVEQMVVAWGLGWAAKKTRLVSPNDGDLIMYGGFGSALATLLNTYVFGKLSTVFQSAGTGSAVATAATTGAAIQAAQASAPATANTGDSYFGGSGVSDLVAFPRDGYTNYYGAGSGLGLVAFPRRYGR